MGISEETLRRELRVVFAHEAADSLTRVESLLARRRWAPGDSGLIDALFREFHTMKVGAAAAGMSGAARELHDAESLLDAARSLGETAAEPGLETLQGVVARVREEVCDGSDAPPPAAPVALAELWPALARATAEAAALERKFVVLATGDGALMVPRTVADVVRGVLLHLIRNAVAHGIEPPAARTAADKPRVGRVHIEPAVQDGVLAVAIEDDGAGLDRAAIAARARSLGWLDEATVLDDDALIALILRPGFSTRANATALAGRGVGMDAVVHAVGALNGSVAVESRDGLGCTVRIAIPLPG